MRMHIWRILGLNPFIDDVFNNNISRFGVFYVCENSRLRAKNAYNCFIYSSNIL